MKIENKIDSLCLKKGSFKMAQKIDFEAINVNGMATQYYNFVDSSYFQTLLVSGCLFFIIIMILLIYICNKL